jgi:hypothetical protein
METLYSIKDWSRFVTFKGAAPVNRNVVWTKNRLQIPELWYTYIVWFNLSHAGWRQIAVYF